MVFRESIIKNKALSNGEVYRECTLVDCTNLDSAILLDCQIITTEKEQVVKKKTKKCKPCEEKKVENANG